MTTPASPAEGQPPVERRWAILGSIALGLVGILSAVVLWLAWQGPTGLPTTSASPDASSAPGASLAPAPAPPLSLTDQDGRAFEITSLQGDPVLVFFGYTHCPDVCPATVGVLNQVLEQAPVGVTALFVSIDPERDTTDALRDYLRFLPDGYIALTGAPSAVRAAADAWGIDYARVDTGSAGGYAMAHTADVFLVDGAGLLRARFPFGTEPEPISEAIAGLGPIGSPPPSVAAVSPGPTGTAEPSVPLETLRPLVISTSIWGGETSPIILALADAADEPLDPADTRARVRLRDASGAVVGSSVEATVVRPPGTDRSAFVVDLPIPSPGRWRLEVEATERDRTLRGETEIVALDPGATAPLGRAAPDARTPTVADAGGVVAAVTTDPQPDLRLTARSTADARAAGQPYVLLVDSYRFRVSPACGRALAMARVLADRWSDVAFIHLEPFHYSIVTSTPVLDGPLSDPPLHPVAGAWGLGRSFWGATSVPWIFVVDGDGVVRAKYQGVVGSDDVDVILSTLAAD
jgi:protein SCO1/2